MATVVFGTSLSVSWMMFTNIQQYFRFYLALALSILLAIGVRLQAAPLGSGTTAKEEVTTSAPAGFQGPGAGGTVAAR
ncbi:hypothetical protein Q3A66_03355 [Hymenobacter sp. BT770]|uniref:hypothetical protein n=1 Tax=Hymenobacter sp. BT770 TaxID=2886942 RepID=UPI001D121E4F|nr:hypothetical protein [Hymenobacter sp. BT770]MCC3152278.1 hypothetical protein [Hymenobacter sp. BT770]MDO3414091.1 hypothetical protein [Hymenobacter sp. BT770]